MSSPPTPFAFGCFRGPDGTAFCGAVVKDTTMPLSRLGSDVRTPEQLLDHWADVWPGVQKSVTDLVTTGAWKAEAVHVSALDVLPPVRPRQIFQSGANYRAHVVQLMMAADRHGDQDLEVVRDRAERLMQDRIDTGTPYVFLGLPSSICGPYDDVVLPATGDQHDWELELAAVIGHVADNVSRERALEHVAGYTIVNDLTTRDRVFRPDMPGLGTDWLAGKNAPTFLPTGPWFVPAAHVAEPANLHITLSLNGEIMQDASTSDMIFDLARLIEHTSAITPLQPGDMLLTGSPAGNGAHYGRFLAPGDVMTSSITGLGTQRNTCVSR
jgi:2-keto-4-pentenoate hydratase/2-oxohepta-3-ene-1,7-dioic acid hydratase in catechol pathway